MTRNLIHSVKDDLAAFNLFQQELMTPQQHQMFIHQVNQQQHLQQQHVLHQQLNIQQQQQQQQQQQHNIQQQQVLPSIMVPPQSPTLSSYYFENGWVNHYNDPKRRQYLSTREQQYQFMLHNGPRKRSHSNMDAHTNQHLLDASVIAAAAAAAITTTTNIPTMQSYSNNEEWRESLLQFAHAIYSVSPQNPFLLDLLHKLHLVAPTHLPTLLLLACVHYSFQDYGQSLRYNHLILKYDGNYVEAMSNIGTTLRSIGKTNEAEKWWYQAVRLRPGYWDAVENLVGVLCSTSSRYKEALGVCEFVEEFFASKSSAIQVHQLPRLLNLFYAKGNLKYALGDILGAQKEYEKGLELAFGGITLNTICNLLVFACNNNNNATEDTIVLLLPEQAVRILHVLFPATEGVLPGLTGTSQETIQQTNQTTSTLLLTLAKLFQDMMNPTTTALANATTKGGTPQLSSLLPLYYLSLALHPSPSTTNNLGIILSNISVAVAGSAVTLGPAPQPLTGTMLAMRYYIYGLQLDPRHPHLYTNLGSLLKDMGHLNEAVDMYERAVEFNPRFDVALANLGNAIKDLGRVQESVQWYRRAVEVNPNFVDAVCGLVNSLSGVCDWRGRGSVGGEASVDQFGNYFPPTGDLLNKSGWIGRVVDIVEKQLNEGSIWGAGILKSPHDGTISVGEYIVEQMMACVNKKDISVWKTRLAFFQTNHKKDEGGWLVRLIERIMRRVQHNWYCDTYGQVVHGILQPRIVVAAELAQKYKRPLIPGTLASPAVPTVLPFHTFTYPLSARQIRLISHRNALRISHTALGSSWVPTHVYPPPPPPSHRIKLGYVSSDFNNHPLSHLMQSVFGFHDTSQFEVHCYATTVSDGSPYRLKIERESENFLDVSNWNNQQVVEKILEDGIHILVNLNGYTKGARNEIFAARPCPVQCSFMGFAGTLAGGWCDWIIADPIVCPPSMVSGEVWRQRRTTQLGDFEGDIDPEEATDDFVYTEKFIYMPHSYFVNDHKQGFRDDHPSTHQELMLYNQKANEETVWTAEEEKRWNMRREVFPNLPDDVIIFANFNQLYKLEPGTFRVWLRILERVPNSILWLLRFPPAGEQHLKRFANEWAGPQVAQRVVFTDVAPKHVHIHRGRVADIFLDTPECNAHTTAADILWSGTPIVTYPKYIHKMCSRVGASIAMATGFGDEMVVMSEKQYEERVVELAHSVSYTYQTSITGTMVRRGHGALMDLRKRLFLSREQSRLFDTQRWTRNLERGFSEAWKRWVTTEEFEDLVSNEKSGCIWVVDPDDAQ
ncbi:hypothetical protein HPULCUR_004974 [Helicostylum pulchrum]|uniref:protein O-GlcNAc transferase n=1 Tax=Helicostylum pulchrum TaxID=562976 RepID=A0ABP9XXS5_9FUNG